MLSTVLNGLSLATILSFVTATVIPLVSALLAKQKWPVDVVGLLTLLLSAVSGFVTEWQVAPHNFDWKTAAARSLVAFGIAVAAHYGIWKGTSTEAALLNVGSGSGLAPLPNGADTTLPPVADVPPAQAGAPTPPAV